jgi:hypothetical protein
MKRLLLAATILAVLCGLAVNATVCEEKKARDPNLGKLRHVVLLQFKEGTTPAQVKELEDAFRALPSRIPAVVGFEWGTNNSPEGLADGFTHCFLVTFDDAKGREAYLPHPAHREFVGLLKPRLEKVLVVDYVARD